MTTTAFNVLVLCSGNVCRSPAVAALLRHALASNPASGRTDLISITSAGWLFDNRPLDPIMVGLLRTRGVDVLETGSRIVAAQQLVTADLIIGMTRAQVRRAVGVEPTVWEKATTLHELAGATSRQPREASQSRREWVQAIHASRSATLYLRDDPSVDVVDPTGKAKRHYKRMLAEIAPLVAQVVVALAAPDPSQA